MFAHPTCMDSQEDDLQTQSDYDRSMQPVGSCDIMLGRNLGTECQLKYLDDFSIRKMDESTRSK
jgi:hypothetical protein